MGDVVLFACNSEDVGLQIRRQLLILGTERGQRTAVRAPGIAVMNQTANATSTTRVARTVSAIRTLAGFKATRANS